jgi:phage baseplate assembly protein V
MSYEDRAAIRAMLRRASVRSVDDSGAQQRLELTGLAADALRKIVRIGEFGLASVPPAGAEGLLACLGGRSDRAMFLGGEHKDYRPTGHDPGTTILYDANGQAVSLIKNNVRVVGTQTITIQAPTVVIQGDCHVIGVVIAGYGGADQVGLQSHKHAANNTPPTAGT